jgi:hypothetical protein
VVVPSCWLLTEWLRSWQALGGPWAVYGVSQWQHPVELALAAVGGVWLISIALVMANVAIVLVIGSLPRLGPSGLRPWLAVLGVIAGLASVGAGPLAFALTPASPSGSGCPQPRPGPSTTGSVTTFRGQRSASSSSPHWSCLRIRAVFLAGTLATRASMRHNM